MRFVMRKGEEGKGSDGSNIWGREMGKYVKGKLVVFILWCLFIDFVNKIIFKNFELVCLFFFILKII